MNEVITIIAMAEFSDVTAETTIQETGVFGTQEAIDNCESTVLPFDHPGGSHALAVRLPAELCEYEGGETLPAPYSAGVVENGSFQPFSSTEDFVPEDAPRQTTDMAQNENTAFWIETDSTALSFDNWRVFAADLSDRESRLLARSEDVIPGLFMPAPARLGLTSAGDRTYWNSYSPSPALQQSIEDKSVDPESLTMLDFVPTVYSVGQLGGDLQSEVIGAQDFSVLGEGLTYIATAVLDVTDRTLGSDNQSIERHFSKAIDSRTVSGVERLVQLNPDANGDYFLDQGITNLQVSGSKIAFSSASDIYLVDRNTHQVVQFAGDHLLGDDASVLIPEIVLTDSRISWIVYYNDQDQTKQTIYTSNLSGSDTKSIQVSSSTELLDNGTGLTYWTGGHADYRKVEWKY
ncbi:hypothetical protein V5R04_07070 [Jonesiaceae bacterium BS-20]|uniref:Uncharacterized protein n=1 Tax=Jonesiaceae bacterium BS-20 TaxID=3120821 RepID=A0AAU7E0B5_9MICO